MAPDPDEALVILVCSPESNYDDDVETMCACCSALVYCRPHAAARVPEGQRVCAACTAATNLLSGLDMQTLISPETMAELRRAVTGGAAHDCDEWRQAGRCILCDRQVS